MSYQFDVNRIMQQASEKGDFEVESLCLNLEHIFSNITSVSPELEKVMETTIDYLYGVVG